MYPGLDRFLFGVTFLALAAAIVGPYFALTGVRSAARLAACLARPVAFRAHPAAIPVNRTLAVNLARLAAIPAARSAHQVHRYPGPVKVA